MAKSTSEREDEDDGFDPLFDYTKVQPLVFDESESEDEVEVFQFQNPSKKRPLLHREDDNKKSSITTVEIDDDKEVEDEDWLAPPPEISKKGRISRETSSFLSKSRTTREELLSLVSVSAEDLIKKVEETAKAEIESSKNSSLEKSVQGDSQRCNGRQKIILSVQDKNGSRQFRLYRDDKFEKLFKAYSDKGKQHGGNIVYSFDGQKILPSQTPEDLDLVDDDIIEAHLKNI